MNRKRIRFIERDYIFKRTKENTEFLTDEEINQLLDRHEWFDYTFIFDIHPDRVKTIIIDNDTGCDVALVDLTTIAFEFYQYQIDQMLAKPAMKKIREILSVRRAV